MIRETIRIFGILVACTVAGGVLGAVCDMLIGLRFGSIYDLGPSIPGGLVMGWASTGFVAPLVWRRPLAPLLMYLFVPAALAITAATVTVPRPEAVLAGGAALLVGAIIAYRQLPIVFPHRLPGLCPSCGYDLHGLRKPRCPECGADLLQSPDRGRDMRA